jgi:hypothetical protein
MGLFAGIDKANTPPCVVHACSTPARNKMFSPTILCVSGLFLAWYLWFRRQKRNQLPLGPPRLPFIGNLHQAPKEAMWATYRKWIKQYGPLVHLDFGGTSVILVGDHEIAKDLLGKKANIYSS